MRGEACADIAKEPERGVGTTLRQVVLRTVGYKPRHGNFGGV
ncbi:MAG: hypothetical protein VKO21_11880 [Candidatus Sericytochromatia bacterium]|nr:hypothetical protein [Candidatus Sericytochromatia bacterium]